MASYFKVLENEDNSNVNDLGVKNQWKQEWLQVKVGENYLSHCTHKIDRSGYALCIYSNCQINYGTNGKTTLRHVSSSNKKHQDNKRAYVTNTIIPNSWHDPTVQAEKLERCEPREVDCSLPYGTAPNIHSISICKSLTEPKKQQIILVVDLTLETEAYILLFAAENSILISKIPNLTEFAKNLSKDRTALQCVKMDRTAATCKLREGLSVYQQCELIKKLKKSNFSINIHEFTTTKSHKRVFSILVKFYDEILKKVVIEHYKYVECILVNSLSLPHKIDYLFKRDGIPQENLISDLSDNTNYM